MPRFQKACSGQSSAPFSAADFASHSLASSGLCSTLSFAQQSPGSASSPDVLIAGRHGIS
eukprot:4442755-Karenia_brevis.AAC.1